MEPQSVEKQMSSTNRKGDKIFNVRRIHHRQFEHQKHIKPNFSPYDKRQSNYELFTQKINKKHGEYNQMAIFSSTLYKEINKKLAELKQEQRIQKEKKLEEIKIKEQQLQKYQLQKQRIDQQREKLIKKRDQLRFKIQQIREKNQALRIQQNQRNQQYRFLNMQYLRNMIIGMRYQNGQEIDPDNMTYEELLQLQQQIGSVSKGLSQQMIAKIPKIQFTTQFQSELCSICYEQIKLGQYMNKLQCQHVYHCNCIKQWLLKQRVCPMCKQQIKFNKQNQEMNK